MIKIAFRNFKKKPVFTLINIFGLAIGLSCCFSILLYVDHEFSFDDFQDESVYRLAYNRVYTDSETSYASSPHSFGPQLVKDYPEVINQTRLAIADNLVEFKCNGESIVVERLIFTDTSIFSVLSLNVIEGDIKTALDDVNSIVLPQSIAQKYFGDESPIGKTLKYNEYYSNVVTAVFEDYPSRSHLKLGALVSIKDDEIYNEEEWTKNTCHTYLQFASGKAPLEIESKFPEFFKRYAEGEIKREHGMAFDDYLLAGNEFNFSLQPIKKIHLESNLNDEIVPNGSITYVYFFLIITTFILVIACINFINLSTARSMERAKEIGVRKILGSDKKTLIIQFLSESILMSIISTLIALCVTMLLTPYLSNICNRDLILLDLATPANLLIIFAITLLTGLIAGLYPALVISSFSPLSVVSNAYKNSSDGIGVRNFLVVFQYSISIVLISATLLIKNQITYMIDRPLGFNKDQLLVIENAYAVSKLDPYWRVFATFKNELKSLASVEDAAYTSTMPGDYIFSFEVFTKGKGSKDPLIIDEVQVDEDFVEVMGFELLEGRDFDKGFEDKLNLVINEAAVKALKLEDPIGAKISSLNDEDERVEYSVIGVIKDFNFNSLHTKVAPMVFTEMDYNGYMNKYLVRLNSDDFENGIASIESKWNQFALGLPLSFYFLDKDLQNFYQTEQVSKRILEIFSSLALVIACIGLLGLSAFIINQKTKEIGIRKVLGSNIVSIIFLLSRSILGLISIALVIAIPITYFWYTSWIDDFAYNLNMNWWLILGIGGAVLLISFLTISIQTYKAATANPVESLKDE